MWGRIDHTSVRMVAITSPDVLAGAAARRQLQAQAMATCQAREDLCALVRTLQSTIVAVLISVLRRLHAGGLDRYVHRPVQKCTVCRSKLMITRQSSWT